MAEPPIALDRVTAGYGPCGVLRDVTLAVAAGEMVGVLGPNGAGKSTLLRVASGVLRPQLGRLLLDGRDAAKWTAREIARTVATLPQETAPVFPSSVLETVLLGRFPWHAAFSFESEDDVGAAEDALRAVEAGHLRDRDLASLSGGERQRVLLARALCQGGRVLLCDEPTAHLDLRHQADVFALLARLRDAGRAIVVVTHDLDLAARACDRLLLIARGEVIAHGAPRDVLTASNAQIAFGITVSVREQGGAIHVVRETPDLQRKNR
ncbi:MAG: ABC transporter ATP-binding protein [Planctomycetes bacterium]|nr:ABC transporter ATP-binding protein [Planctomycetota bacterium]